MDQRNLLLAAIISVTILLGWHLLFEQPRVESQRQAEQQHQTQQKPAGQPGDSGTLTAPAGVCPSWCSTGASASTATGDTDGSSVW